MPRKTRRSQHTRRRARVGDAQARKLDRLARQGRLHPPELQVVELAEVVGWDPLRDPQGPPALSWDDLTA
jgi:hypothetical protein